MDPLSALLPSRDPVPDGDATDLLGEPQSDLLSPVVYRANGRSEPEETGNRLRKGLNRISTDSATSTYEMVDANGSSQSPGSDDSSSSTSTDGHGGDGEEEDDDEEEDAMWSNIVRINKATSATVAELTGSSGSGSGSGPGTGTGDPANEIEYEVQEAMVSSGVAMAIGSFDHEGGGGGGACELLQRKRFDLARSSTKEEKQRHNEEILIMKSNSLSSDTTNSWEPISVEACYPEPAPDEPVPAPAAAAAAAPSKACFIDASSLFDDDEIVYPSFQEPPVAWSTAGTTRSASSTTVGNEPSVQLSSILLCDDVKSRSDGSSERPSATVTMEVKDQFCARPSNEFLAAKLKLPELVESQADDCTEEVLARQQSERKQGTMLFQNSIQQFSGLQLDAAPAGGPPFATADEPCSDLSLPSVYSSGSERNYGGEYSSLSISDTQRYSLSSAAGAYGGTIDESGSGRQVESFRCTSTSGYNSSSADYNSRTQATSDGESGHYPNTPFNSIVHVTSSQHGNGSRASSIDRESHSTPIRIPKRVQKHDESAPIVSGGASIEDFTPKQCESPSVRRRTDTCPIVSGGISFEEDPRDALLAGQGRRLSKSSSGKSWVVDLKNCPDDEKQVTGSLDGQQRHHQQPRNCGLGFYVDLGSLKTPEEEKPITEVQRPRPAVRADLMKKSTGFYIDLSDGESTRSATPKLSGRNDTPPPSAVPRAVGDEDVAPPAKTDSREESMEKDRKNMFSMFIDFGDEKNGNSAIAKPPAMLRKQSLPPAVSLGKDPSGTERPSSLGPAGEEGTKPYYMFVGGASAATPEPSPVVRRPVAAGAATASGSQARNESKRHSWNTSTFGGEHSGGFHERRIANSATYQRSTSVTSDRGIMNILDKIPLLSKTSSMSIDSSVSPFEDFTCSKSELSTYSNHSVSSNSGHSSNESKVSPAKETDGGPSGEPPVEMTPAMGASVKRKRKDVKLNETFDKSSQGSVTDGILSSNEDASPTSTTTDTDDVTFQNNPVDEEALLAANAAGTVQQEEPEPVECPVKLASKQMETIEEAVESSPRHGPATAPRKAQHTMETLHATIEKQKQLLETVSENVESSGVVTSFVKLSDMDKPPLPPPPPATQSVTVTKFELHSSSSVAGSSSSTITGGGASNMSNSAGSNRVARLFECQKYNTIGSAVGASQAMRLQQHQQQKSSQNYYQTNGGVTSMERHSWNMSRSTGNNFVSLISSSVENSRSLSRLFPHLSKAFSNSLPSDVGMNGAGRGQVDGTELLHSDFSCTSSITSSRSGIESIDESISSRQPRRLGEDLLKMFLQEIATDVTIEVETRKMRAHKCILRSRCQYFAAILAGSWVQNAGNVIALPGYSYAAVHFALCHIYSGASHPPEGISLMELAALSDLLGLEGLKEVTAYALKTNYCHNFHKPCVGCTDGVLQVLPVTLNHGLDDLYRKCLKWVCRHYVKIWSQKQFSLLPLDVVHRCRQQIVAHLSSESVLTLILDSEQLLTLLHPYKWSVEVENVVRDILDASYDYITDHFASLLASDSFLSLGQNYRWAIPHVEPVLLPAANNLSPDQACKSYPRATRLHKLLQAKVLTMTTTTTTTTTTATPLAGDTSVVNVYEKQQGKRPKDDYKRHEEEEEMDWCDEFVGMVNAILSAVEQCLIRQCARAMRVSSWQRMDVELRNKVQKLACLMETTDERKSRSRYSFSSQTSSSSSVHSRTNDLRQVRLAIQAHNKRAYEGNGNRTQQTQTTVAQHNDLNSALLASHKLAKHLDDDLLRKQQKEQHHQPPPLENGYRVSRTSSKTNHTTAPVPESGRKAPVAAVRQTNGIAMGLLAKTNRRDASAPPLVEPVPAHRRSQSEDHAVYGAVKQQPPSAGKGETVANLRSKLSHIKPRYLEPKKPKNAANLQAQNNNISSSGSSTRTASPAFGHRNKLKQQPATATTTTTTVAVKGGHESNISLDSLTSPAKLRNGGVPAKAPRSTISELDVSIDSLAESLKSNSIKTSNTLSHESLIYHEYFKPKQITDQPNGLAARERRTKVVPPVATARPPTAVANGGGPKPIHNSSIPRSNGGINRTGSSASVGSANGGGIKRSFLTQRSREILARRSHEPKSNSTNSSNKSAASSPSLLLARDKSTTGSDITKSGSSASLSTTNSGGGGGTGGCGRKVFNTTLHLRRTAKLLPTAGPHDNPTLRQQQPPLKSSSSSSVHRRMGDKNGLKTAGRKVDSTAVPGNRGPLKHAPVTGAGNCYGGPPASLPPIATTTAAGRIESKLERSNTFSMDASDNALMLQLLD
ncbi:serine-rich adhesin for platelets [Anopheles cruzii]|uniref:serine-rich adhesin for platelets n=1 Tax=Anopheles cruzii TaxID=68878 RepID=UPI0022EC6FF7|nr:serine-rich adhesin for platelets [Anopheles cruzii]